MSDPQAIKDWAKSFAPLLDGGKIIVPQGFAKKLRKIGAWDDESMYEQRDLLPVGGVNCSRDRGQADNDR